MELKPNVRIRKGKPRREDVPATDVLTLRFVSSQAHLNRAVQVAELLQELAVYRADCPDGSIILERLGPTGWQPTEDL